MFKNKRVAVVVPAYNEEKLIGQVIETMPPFVDAVVVVDDNSRDGTAAVVEACREREDRVVLLRNSHTQGCGGALALGYIWAMQNDFDIVVRMDGDAQMNPEDLPAIVSPVADGEVDYTKGNRLFSGEAYHRIPKVRYFGNAILSLLTKVASGYWHIADSQSGYTAVSCAALQRIELERMYKRYGQPNDLLVRMNVANLRVRDVPVKPVYGIGEKSGIRIHVVVFTISWLLVKLFCWRLKEKYVIRDFHPLVFFYLMGLLLLALSGLLFVRLCILWGSNGHIPAINALAWMFSASMGLQALFFAMWFDMDNNKELR